MKKIGIISLALVLALGGLGLGYAHWSDTLYINGDIEAGSLTLAFAKEIAGAPVVLGYVDNESLNDPVKEVGWGEIYYDPASEVTDPHTGKTGYKKLELVVHNAYPQYKIDFTTVIVQNIGTIPVHIVGFDIYDPTNELKFVWTDPPPVSPALGFFWKDFDGDGELDVGEEEIINVTVVNFVCVQLDKCNSTKGEIDLEFKQPLEECHTYHFEVTIDGVQWNKYVP